MLKNKWLCLSEIDGEDPNLKNLYEKKFILKSIFVKISILMIGPTGCGKTEIARRISHLSNAPFIKVEATKYTEIGYHGDNVENMIKDLVSLTIKKAK